jgi:two-component system cell cycle response regulator DivK
MRLLKDILEGSGYETLQAADGLEAIDLAFARLPDLILMDIQLPEISGLEITRRLKGDDRSRRIPIVAVTAFAMGWHEREALDSGCDGYISKPISVLGFFEYGRVVPVAICPLVPYGFAFPESRQRCRCSFGSMRLTAPVRL